MGIMVPKTCWVWHKHNKVISGIYLDYILQLFKECLCIVALGIQHAVRTHHVVICGLPGSTVFFRIISKTVRFSEEKLYLTLTPILLTWRIWWAPNNASRLQMGFNSAFKGLNVCLIFSTNCIWNISYPTKNWARYDQKCIFVFM